MPVTFAEAALGAEITVPAIDKPVTLKVPAGTKSGRTFRVRGRGVRTGSEQGDLLVTVEIAVPSALSDEERRAIESLSQVMAESPRAHLEA